MLTKREAEQRLSDGAVVIPMARDLVITTGEDAASFLNGQLSQAIDSIEVGESRWSMLLEPQGKFGHWLRVTRVSDTEFWLDTEPGQGEAMLSRLNRFLMRTKAAFELTEAKCFAVRGQKATAHPESSASQRTVAVVWGTSFGFDVLGSDVAQPEGDLADPALLEALRVADALPAAGAEILPSTIPAETGIVDISTSFTKGCYTGQELVARVNSRGNNTPRKIHRVRIDGDALPEAGAQILVEGEPVGELTSVAELGGDVIGLASIKRGTMAEDAAVLSVGVADGEASLTAELLPYRTLGNDGEG